MSFSQAQMPYKFKYAFKACLKQIFFGIWDREIF